VDSSHPQSPPLRQGSPSRPSLRDLNIFFVGHPRLKPWAIVETSLRDEDVMLAGIESKTHDTAGNFQK